MKINTKEIKYSRFSIIKGRPQIKGRNKEALEGKLKKQKIIFRGQEYKEKHGPLAQSKCREREPGGKGQVSERILSGAPGLTGTGRTSGRANKSAVASGSHCSGQEADLICASGSCSDNSRGRSGSFKLCS